MSDRCARRDAAALSSAELTEALASNANHPWKPPGGGHIGALTHDVIHGLDITEALGLRLPVKAPKFPREVWLEFMGRDKKNEGGRITLILLEALGRAVVVRDTPARELEAFLAES